MAVGAESVEETYRARGMVFDRRMRASRVRRGTRWTMLVAAMNSSAGSPRKSSCVDVRATSRSSGHA